MSDPASRSPSLATKLAAHAWWILLLAALALHGLATERRINRIEAITNLPTWSVDAPQLDASSPTGFELGQRELIVPGHHNPSFVWIMEAQKTVENGKLRLRHIDYDDAPNGRDIRRTSPYRWWLITTGWLHATISGEPLGYAIERCALIADPILFALMLIAGGVYSARYLGSFAAIGFVIGGISFFPLIANFQPGAPDPHSLAWVLALGSVLPLFASLRKVGTQRRTHFIIAGIFGGLGLWNDATSQAPVLLAIFLGAIGYELIRSRDTEQAATTPSNWRAWAIAGTLTTLASSIFEFAPNYFTWSLDAISPIHAVAWWGFGEAILAASTWSKSGRKGFDRQTLALLGGAVLAIAAWPLAGILSENGLTLLASDFYARELANHPSGGIAPSLSIWLGRANSGAKLATLLPCVFLFILPMRIFMSKIDSETRGRLVFVLVTVLFAVVLAFFEIRWWNLFNALALVGLTVLFAETEIQVAGERLKTLGLALLVLPGLFVGFPPAVEGDEVSDLTQMETMALIERDFSYWLNKRSGSEPNVIFSTPIFSSAAAYYGGIDVIVSNDSTNNAGYLTATRIASSDTEQEVSILLNSRSITHVVLPVWDPTMDHFVRIGMNVPAGKPLPLNAFSVALRDWDLPAWMRAMNYSIPQELGFKGYSLNAFALQAEQAPELGLSRLTDLFVERGQMVEARSIREALKSYPRSVVAMGSIANVDYALRDRASLDASLEKLIPYLSRRSSRNLPADRRITLAVLFMRTNKTDLAREQITACLEKLDTTTLRTLTPDAISGLIAISHALAIPFPDEKLETAALELIPPNIRERLTQN